MATKDSLHQCSICLNEYYQPKLIDCHHSFCSGCLEDYVARFATNGQFPCPLCRRNIQVPTGGVKDFSSNFYIDQTVSVGKMYCVNHDEQKPIELYCNQCFQAVCSKCFTTKHNGHEFLDLESETTKGAVKRDQTEVSKQLEEKVKRYDDHLEMLKFKTLRLYLITKTSIENVEKKVEELCAEIKKHGEDFITKIQDLDDREREKLNKTNYEIQEKRKDMESYVKLLANSSNVQSLVGVLDTLPKAKALLADNSSTDINFPDLCFPIFKTNQEGLNVTGEQLGEYATSKMILFVSSFDFESLKDEEKHCSVENHDLGQLSVCLAARKRKEKLGLYLNLNKNHNSKNIMFCTIQFTIKLVSYTDSTKSKLLKQNYTFKAAGQSWGWSFMDWDKLVDPENGFIDEKNNVHVEATAIFTELQWKE